MSFVSPLLRFQPPGFGERSLQIPQGHLVYYTQTADPWPLDELANAPLLLFLHSFGGGSSAYEWSKVYAALGTHYRIVAPDLLGWGGSDHPAWDYTREDYLGVLRNVMAALPDRPCCVIASSLVAALVIQLAIETPTAYDRLFLACPSGYHDFADQNPGEAYSQGLAATLASIPGIDRLIYALGAANEVAIQNFLTQFLFADAQRLTEELIQAYLTSALQPRADYAALAALRGTLFFDLAPLIPRLTVPTSLVWGTQAQFRSLAQGQALQALNPGTIVQFHAIEQAGVLPQLEQPGVVAALLSSWLTRSPQPTPV